MWLTKRKPWHSAGQATRQTRSSYSSLYYAQFLILLPSSISILYQCHINVKKKWYLLICLVRSAGDLTWWGRANPDRSESPYLSSNLRISFESIFRNGLMRLSWKITPLAQVAIVWPQEVGKQRAPLRTYRDILVSSFCPRGLYRKLSKSIFGKSRDSGDSVYMLSNQETPMPKFKLHP